MLAPVLARAEFVPHAALGGGGGLGERPTPDAAVPVDWRSPGRARGRVRSRGVGRRRVVPVPFPPRQPRSAHDALKTNTVDG